MGITPWFSICRKTSSQHLDSTTNNNDTTAVSVTTQGSSAGTIDGADTLDGLDDSITVNDSATLDITSAVTIEAWVNTDTDTNLGDSGTPGLSCWHILRGGGSTGDGYYYIESRWWFLHPMKYRYIAI